MKQIKTKSVKTLLATILLSTALTLGANAQQTVVSNGNISSEVKVKETNMGNALLDLSVSNKSTSPYLILIRDNSGTIIFKEWAKGESYKKRFKLDIIESNEFSFEVIQDKKLVDSKQFKVTHRTEEKFEILAVN